MTPDQERLGPENRTEHYLWKGMFFSTLKDIIEAQNKTYNWITLKFMIICLKDISEECFFVQC